MPQPKATLKDIAHTLGVSTTTVHRALNGKQGVSDEVSLQIRQLAAQMGYKTNYMASALKRKDIHFAVALPKPTLDDRYYYLNLWQGVRRFFSEITEFSAEPLEFHYPLTPDGNGMALKQIYEQHCGDISGLITIAVEHNQSSYFLEKLAGRGVPILLIGADMYQDLRLCCVKAYDELAGSLAAELLCSFYPRDFAETIILTGNPTGDFPMPDQAKNAAGFVQYLRTHAPNARILTAYSPVSHHSGNQVRALLAQHPEVYAIYSTSARHTVQMCQVLETMELSGRIRLIGNDRFPESEEYLAKGTLSAIIDKKIMKQSYQASQILFNYVLKGEYPSSSTVYVEPSILLHSCMDFTAHG